jgi:hypothetical protein
LDNCNLHGTGNTTKIAGIDLANPFTILGLDADQDIQLEHVDGVVPFAVEIAEGGSGVGLACLA